MDHLLKQKMDTLEMKFGEMSSMLTDLHSAIVGNKITNDGGMIGRVIFLEKEVEQLENRIEQLEKDKNKTDIYIKIMWGLGGIVSASVVGFILSLILKK